MVNIMPESWRDRPFRPRDQDTSGQSIAEVLPAHDAETTSSSKAQYRLEKLVNQVRCDGYVASLEQVPETTPLRGTGNPHGEKERRGFAKAQQRSQTGPGATAFLRARTVDSSRVISASEFVSAGRRFLGMEEILATTGAPVPVRRTQTRGMRDCVIDRMRRSTSTSPWSTRSSAPLR